MLFSKSAEYCICKSITELVYNKYYYLDYYLHHVLTEIFVVDLILLFCKLKCSSK